MGHSVARYVRSLTPLTPPTRHALQRFAMLACSIHDLAHSLRSLPRGTVKLLDMGSRCNHVQREGTRFCFHQKHALTFIQHASEDGFISGICGAIPPFKPELVMTFKDSCPSTDADAEYLLRKLLTNFDLLIHQTWIREKKDVFLIFIYLNFSHLLRGSPELRWCLQILGQHNDLMSTRSFVDCLLGPEVVNFNQLVNYLNF